MSDPTPDVVLERQGGLLTATLADGRKFTFCAPDLEDLVSIDDELPVLPATDGEDDPADPLEAFKRVQKDPPRLSRVAARATAGLVRCSVDPELSAERVAARIPEGQVSIRTIDDMVRLEIWGALLVMCGYSRAAGRRVDPSSETQAGDVSSIESAGATA
jgi:hypothetical protein